MSTQHDRCDFCGAAKLYGSLQLGDERRENDFRWYHRRMLAVLSLCWDCYESVSAMLVAACMTVTEPNSRKPGPSLCDTCGSWMFVEARSLELRENVPSANTLRRTSLWPAR